MRPFFLLVRTTKVFQRTALRRNLVAVQPKHFHLGSTALLNLS